MALHALLFLFSSDFDASLGQGRGGFLLLSSSPSFSLRVCVHPDSRRGFAAESASAKRPRVSSGMQPLTYIELLPRFCARQTRGTTCQRQPESQPFVGLALHSRRQGSCFPFAELAAKVPSCSRMPSIKRALRERISLSDPAKTYLQLLGGHICWDVC